MDLIHPISFALIPDLVALSLVSLALAYLLIQAPVPEISAPLRCGVTGAFLFLLGVTLTEAVPAAAGRWPALALSYGGHMLSVPAWLLVSARLATMNGLRLPGVLARLVNGAPWLFVGFFAVFVTSPVHGLFVTPIPGERELHHALWGVYALAAYGSIGAAVAIQALLTVRGETRQARRQAAVLLLALFLPAVANLAFAVLPLPPEADPTSLGYAAGMLVLAAAGGQPLLAITPVAFSNVLQHDEDGVVLTDRSGRTHYANPAALALFGRSALAVGSPALEALAPRLRSPGSGSTLEATTLAECLLGGAPSELQVELPESERVLRIQHTPVPNRFGRTVARALRFRDETQLHEARLRLREQASTLEAVLRSSPDGFIIVGADDRVRYLNEPAIDLVQLDPSARSVLDGRQLRSLMRERAETPQVVDRVIERLHHRPEDSLRYELRLKDGRILETSTAPLLVNGELAGRVWQTRDRTAERHRDEAMRNTQKLESLGVMAGGIAHDFNNLLVGVLGNAELARMALDERSPACEPLAAVQLAAEQASDLTRQLLAYAGKDDDASFAPLDLRTLVTETRDLLAVSTPRGVELQIELPSDPATVTGDVAQLRQVLMNLVMNAAESLESRAGRVRVCVDRTRIAGPPPADLEGQVLADGDDLVRLQVIDEGCGMDEDTRTRLFEPFFTTKFAGRGLGLAATLGIVRAHGGALRVESVRGEGTRFEVLLPARSQVLEEPAARARAAAWSGSGRILIVDDEPHVRKVARTMLRQLGFEVEECSNGREALNAIGKDPGRYQAVLLDLAMPVLSGLDVALELAGSHPELPVVLCSGHPLGAEGGLPPVAASLRKPFSKQQLSDAMCSALTAA